MNPRPEKLAALLFLVSMVAASAGTSITETPGERVRLPYFTPWAIRFGKLVNPHCLWRVPTSEKAVALTFDDGPSANHMPALLSTLRKHRLKATFFVLGSRLDDSPNGQCRRAVLREAMADGHEIALHGMTHRSLFKVPDAVIEQEIHALRQRIAEVGGEKEVEVQFFRPPFGHVNARISKAVSRSRCRPVAASILPGDAFFPEGWQETPERTVRRVLRELHPGAILCLHIGEASQTPDRVYDSPYAAEIVDQLAPALSARGYCAVPLGKLTPR